MSWSIFTEPHKAFFKKRATFLDIMESLVVIDERNIENVNTVMADWIQ